MYNILSRCKLTRVSNAVAAGTSAVNSSVVDMSGFDGVTFQVAVGAIVSGAATSLKIQQGQESDGSDMADLAGSSITIGDTDDNKLFAVEIVQPRERYLRCVVSRATQNATIDSITAIQSVAAEEPTTHDSSTVGGTEIHLAPAEGTA